MPDTRPGITFNKDGVCSACQAYENRVNVDYAARFNELKALCDKHRRHGNEYDCIIAVSGGKDSHFQTNLIKNILKMNPLLVTVEDNFPLTNAGGAQPEKHIRTIRVRSYQHETEYQGTEKNNALHL